MRTGELRHPIVIQEKISVKDGVGNIVETWIDFTDDRAAIWPVSSGELVKNQQVEHQISHKVRIRYRPGILSSMRIVYGTRIFNIGGLVIPDERNRWLDLLCTEVS